MKLSVLIGSTSLVSLGVGTLAGFLLARHLLEKKYDELLREEVARTKAFYSKVHKPEEYETPEKTVKALIPDELVEAMKEYQGRTEPPANHIVDYRAVSKGQQVVKNIFKPAEVDIDEEIRNRTEEAPYIISVREYSENESDYEQKTLTWYEGDSVLADEKDDHIPDIDHLVGENNLPRFGHRSEDPDTLFVRNDALEMDFEIVRKPGKYKEIVLGMTD